MNLSKYLQKGGLQIDSGDAKEAFEHFISNSTISLLSRGSFGLTFVAKLNPGVTTNYKHLVWSRYDLPVETLLFKVSCIYELDNGEQREKIDLSQQNNNIELTSVDIKEFKQEVNTQIDIFFKSISYLQPYCPGIVYANNYKNTEETHILLDKITNNINNNIFSGVLRSIKQALIGDECSSIGIIGMEFLQGYDTIYNLNKLNPDTTFNNYMLGYYILMKVAVDTGYSHGDFHSGNLLINPYDIGYFGKAKINNIVLGSPMMIDFGLALKIPPEQHKLIKNYYLNEEYSKIFEILCNLGRSDKRVDLYSHDMYAWVCHNLDWKPFVKTTIKFLINKREKGINNTVKVFDKMHNDLSSSYPRLPVSNEIKNRLFSGMIDPEPISINKIELDKRQQNIENFYNMYAIDAEDDLDVNVMLNVNNSPFSNNFSIGGKYNKSKSKTKSRSRKYKSKYHNKTNKKRKTKRPNRK
jgi:hypothetical protein